MTQAWTLRRWSSPETSRHGGELIPAPLSSDTLTRALAGVVAGDANDLAFVIVRVGADGDAGLRRAIDAARAASMEPRLCLAVDLASLEAIDAASIGGERIDIMLDDVDADTPLSAIANGSVESIRFRADFVARASRNLRLGCVLESMLLLAHNLGLSTMGPSTPEGDGSISATPRFDYVPSASVSFIAAPPPAPRLAFADGLVLPARISR